MSYDKWWDSSALVDMGGTDDSVQEHAVKLWLPGPRGDILEIGCGRGRLISKFATDFSLNDFIGYDPSEQLLAMAPAHKNVRYTNQLPDQKFVFIYSMLVFQHIPDTEKQRYIEWAAQHLQPGSAFKFQYVNEGQQAPRNFPIADPLIDGFCRIAGLLPVIIRDDKYPQWSWCVARLPK